MSKWYENQDGTEENGYQKSLFKMSKITFIDMCKSYIIALIVFIFLGVLADSTHGNIALQVLLLVGFGYPLYCNAWGEGYRDLNRFEFDRITADKLRGFKFATFALIPHFVIAFIMLLSYFTKSFEIMFFYRMINIHAIPILNAITRPDILTIDYNILQILAYAIIPHAITLILVGVGYLLGFSNFSILDKIIYKKTKSEELL